jgi:hypothetical protein
MSDEQIALEKLHTDASGTPGPRPGSGKEWLNTSEVVDRLIRDFSKAVLEKALEGEIRAVMPWLEFECTRMNNLFLGITPSDRFDVGPWNTPEQCGSFVLKELRINGEGRTAVRDAFMVFASKLIKTLAAVGNTDFSEQHGAVLDGMVKMLRLALLGIPQEALNYGR